MSCLGMDAGTSGCKAARQAAADEEYDFLRPQPGWAELDPQQVWQQVKSTLV